MKAIILAAGVGERLQPLTNSTPKSLVKLNGVPLISFTLKCLANCEAIDEIIIVTGYLKEQMVAHIDDTSRWLEKRVVCVENKKFKQGSVFSLLKAKDHVAGESFVVANADHIYHPRLWQSFLQAKGEIVLAVQARRDPYLDEMKIRFSGNRVVEIGKTLPFFDAVYIGLCLCSPSGGAQLFKRAEFEIRRGTKSATPEEIYGLIASTGRVYCVDCSGHLWFEIDTEEDLARAVSYDGFFS